jgi:hypothetical protein
VSGLFSFGAIEPLRIVHIFVDGESLLNEALGALEPVRDELHPAEHAWIDGISVTLHAAGIRSLAAELVEQEAPALAASEPLLEAAE